MIRKVWSHRRAVLELLQRCYDAGDIELDVYSGKYCVSCEEYYTDDELLGPLQQDAGGWRGWALRRVVMKIGLRIGAVERVQAMRDGDAPSAGTQGGWGGIA